jgi:hypothetical protein
LWRRRAGGAQEGLPHPPRGQRVLVAGAALIVTAVIGIALVGPHVEFLRHKKAADVLKPCAPGQTRDCVGGITSVIVAPSASASR